MIYPNCRSAFARVFDAKFLCFVFAVVLLCVDAKPVLSNDTTERLRTSVARMNQWLGSGSKARSWRKFLELNVLDSQTARGEQANPMTLRSILSRFEHDHESLEHSVFEEVRSAIKAQIEQIEKTQTQELTDLKLAVNQAIEQFKRPSKAQLEFNRDVARYELEVLKKVYRLEYGSSERAKVFHELKLNKLIDVLSDLEIEMPPEVSVGKMNSMIADERKRLEKVNDEIDALPIQTPEEDTDDKDIDEDAPIELEVEFDPPGPDDDDDGGDLKSLESRKEAIEDRIRKLLKSGKEVSKKDRPRQLLRRMAGRELRLAQRRFRSMALKRTDGAFVSAKQALDRFADQYAYSTEDNIQEEFLEEVSELAKLMPDLDDPNARQSHAKIGSILDWLESRQQLADLCVAIRRRYSNPNAYLAISSRMIQGLTTRTSSEYDRVAEDFLGRFARGLSFTSTTVNVVPIDNPDQVHVGILLNGTASTDTYIRERAFRIDSSASGYLSARRDLFANLNGLFATQASADANISTQYGGINSTCGLVQKFARKSFDKEQGRANAESSRRAQERLESRFTSETSDVIDEAVEQIESLAGKAREVSAFLPNVFFRSFSQRIEVVAKKDSRVAFGATSNPTFQTAGSDIQLKLHDSMLSNYLDAIFSGRRMGPEDVVAEINAFAGEEAIVLPTDSSDAGVEDFKITFAKVRPVQIEFADNRLGVTVSGTRFELGDDSYKTSVSINLKFKLVNRNGKLLVVIDGKPDINLSEDQDPDAESIAFAKILEERLGEAVEESKDAGFELPANLIPSVPQLSNVKLIQSLQLGLFEINNGWLYVGWNWQGGSVNTPGIWNEVVINNFDPLYLPDSQPILNDENAEDSVIVLPEPVRENPVTLPAPTSGLLDEIETGLGR